MLSMRYCASTKDPLFHMRQLKTPRRTYPIFSSAWEPPKKQLSDFSRIDQLGDTGGLMRLSSLNSRQ
jgi:hypothetical protein